MSLINTLMNRTSLSLDDYVSSIPLSPHVTLCGLPRSSTVYLCTCLHSGSAMAMDVLCNTRLTIFWIINKLTTLQILVLWT